MVATRLGPLLLAALTLLGVAVNADAASAQPKKPNILVIWGDDVGVHNISAYNHGIMGYRTPNIDRIAREGAMFTTPTPSRAAPPGGPRSSWASIPSGPGCLRSACPAATTAPPIGLPRLPTC
jgi:arylsulfatase